MRKKSRRESQKCTHKYTKGLSEITSYDEKKKKKTHEAPLSTSFLSFSFSFFAGGGCSSVFLCVYVCAFFFFFLSPLLR